MLLLMMYVYSGIVYMQTKHPLGRLLHMAAGCFAFLLMNLKMQQLNNMFPT
jgi:hypothetical protein